MNDSPPPSYTIPASDAGLLAECRVETFRAGGPGGQHQNTTDSGVRLVHLPTGLRVVARNERSQTRNRTLALSRLREKLEKRAFRPPPRHATKVPRSQKEKRRDAKRRKGTTKRLRKPPDPSSE